MKPVDPDSTDIDDMLKTGLQRLWGKDSVAKLLGVPRSFVDKLVQEGELDVVPLGYRTHQISDTSLRRYMRRKGLLK